MSNQQPKRCKPMPGEQRSVCTVGNQLCKLNAGALVRKAYTYEFHVMRPIRKHKHVWVNATYALYIFEYNYSSAKPKTTKFNMQTRNRVTNNVNKNRSINIVASYMDLYSSERPLWRLSSDSSEVVPHWQWQLGGELWTPATHLFFIKVYDNPCNHGYTPTYLSRFQHFIGKTWVCCKQHPTCFLPQVNSSSSFWSPPILGPMGSSRWATRGGFLWDPIRIQSTENKNHRDLLNKDTGGWFQPIWKIWVNLDHFPK